MRLSRSATEAGTVSKSRLGRGKRAWVRVTRAHPCPICERPDFCSVSGDLVCCMRVASERKAQGDFGGWLHKIGDAVQPPLPKPTRPQPKVDWHLEAKRMFEHKLAEKTRLDLAASLGVSVDSLTRLGVGFGADKREFSSWPERGTDGRVCGIVTRYESGAKKMLTGSHHGLYFAVNWRESTDLVLCPEGGSDTAALLTMGLFAIGRPSNIAGVDLLIAKLRRIRPLKVIVLGERDEKPERRGNPKTPTCTVSCNGCALCWPGLWGAEQTAQRLAKSLAKTEVIYRLPPSKDVRAWLNERRGNGNAAGAFLAAIETEAQIAAWRKRIEELNS